MRNAPYYLILLLAILMLLTPFVDGVLFKQIFTERVAMYQKQLQDDPEVKLSVVEYNLGWIKSTAKVSITYTHVSKRVYQIPPVVVFIDSVIHHGPLIYANEKFNIGYAQVDSSLHLPEMLQGMFSDDGQGFLHVTSLVSTDGKTWNSHYQIPQMSSSNLVKWDGLSGDVVITMANDTPVKIDGTMTMGQLTMSYFPQAPKMPAFGIAPIVYEASATRDADQLWSSNSKITGTGFAVRWQDGRTITATNFMALSKYGVSNSLYNVDVQLSLDSLQLTPDYPITSISNFKYDFAVNNLDATGLRDYQKIFRSGGSLPSNEELISRALKILTATTGVNLILSFNTNLGPSKADVKLSLQSVPKNSDEFLANLNCDLNARFAGPFLEKIFNFYMKQQMAKVMDGMSLNDDPAVVQAAPGMPDVAAMTKKLIDSMVEQGFLVRADNDYVVAFSKKGT